MDFQIKQSINIFKVLENYSFKTPQMNGLFFSFLANLQHPENTRIFLIRHGNAFHNKPLQLTGSMFNRTVDTNLTPLGIYQARILGEELIKSGYLKEENITVKDTADTVNPLEIIVKEKVGG